MKPACIVCSGRVIGEMVGGQALCLRPRTSGEFENQEKSGKT